MDKLLVFREIGGEYELVGILRATNDGAAFSYAEEYLESSAPASISVNFPLHEGPFESAETRRFFDGLAPEGQLRKAMSAAFHSDRSDYREFMARLNNESAGALVFAEDPAILVEGRGYKKYTMDDLEDFARSPRSGELRAGMVSRLSLAGAQAKIGLHHVGVDVADGWLLPMGSAPSTYIVKAVDDFFPGQTINEALCMKVATALGYETADCELIDIDGFEPLLAVKRFDRLPAEVGGDFPRRLHQEDFCQALGYEPYQKYEPTDGNYAINSALMIGRTTRNPFGDRMGFLSRLLLDWAIGNCDNHLKNHSLLWGADWGSRTLSPIYDLTCTTIYPELDREMGVSLCRSRKIDDVRRGDLVELAKQLRAPRHFLDSELEEIDDKLLVVLESCVAELVGAGFSQAEQIGERIAEGYRMRRAALDA